MQSKYIPPYTAVGLTSETKFIQHRDEIPAIIDEIANLARTAVFFSSFELPVKLVALTEGALQGFIDEVLDMSANDFIRDIAISLEGPEVQKLKELAIELNVYLAFQARTFDDKYEDRFFNQNVLLNPKGEIILQHYKNTVLYPSEHSTTPHDVLDQWVEEKGNELDAFYPVADTDIGKIGFAMAMDGSYPEYVRGIAMNGGELLIRVSLPAPIASKFEIQNRAHALNNTMYVLGVLGGNASMDDTSPIDIMGGASHVVDYQGNIIGSKQSPNKSFVAGTIDIEQLREFRITSPIMNWIKDLRSEIIAPIYNKQILPANMNRTNTAYNAESYTKEVLNGQVKLMLERGIFTPPSSPNWEERIVGATNNNEESE
ncbi:hydrolase [Vibrio inusitatus NBRC 102082]|uniref:Hydrolase n=1 Tax=Vibrio inusitatus NBRC 102082 TaxID=1219070 RepID=A0A4Y3HQS3_9VIBR|nr:nitrilase-related carbon-nitrogen hydrolase [Vibrio inusitatus]GEA49493.1 hydrolase [Vibrio inusitatus NBRC 102082]